MGTTGDSGDDFGDFPGIEIDRDRNVDQIEAGRKTFGDEEIGTLVDAALGDISLDTVRITRPESLRQLVTTLAPGPDDFHDLNPRDDLAIGERPSPQGPPGVKTTLITVDPDSSLRSEVLSAL